MADLGSHVDKEVDKRYEPADDRHVFVLFIRRAHTAAEALFDGCAAVVAEIVAIGVHVRRLRNGFRLGVGRIIAAGAGLCAGLGAGRFLGDLRCFQVMTQGLIDLDRFFPASFADAFLVAILRAGGFLFFVLNVMT